jgi:TetR/AcrR family transcriptional regulator
VEKSIKSGTSAWQSLKQNKRNVIFDAAVKEFSEKGYTSASMNSLVKTAGISKGSIFKYFHSKSELFDGIVDVALSGIKNYLKDVRAETRDQCLADRLGEFLRHGFLFVDKHPRLSRIYFHLLRSGDAPFSSRQLNYITQSSTRFLTKLILEAQDKNEIDRIVNAGRLAFLLNALLEKQLSAYYSRHLSQDVDLYQADLEIREEWICLLKSLLYGDLFNRPALTGELNDR